MWKAILFDMDGLMIDSERLYFRAQGIIAAEYNVELKESTLHKMMGKKPVESLEIFRQDLGIETPAYILLNRRNEIMRHLFETELTAMPGLMEILTRFPLKKAVVTGSSEEFLSLALNRLKIADKFDALVHSDLVQKGKPDPELYSLACSTLHLRAEDCIALEDSENGVIAAHNAGCSVISIPSHYTKTQNFTKADFVAVSLFEAAEIINSYNSGDKFGST